MGCVRQTQPMTQSKLGRSRVMLQNPVVHLPGLCRPKWPWWLRQAPTPRLNSPGMKSQPYGFQVCTLEHLLCPFWTRWPWANHFTSLILFPPLKVRLEGKFRGITEYLCLFTKGRSEWKRKEMGVFCSCFTAGETEKWSLVSSTLLALTSPIQHLFCPRCPFPSGSDSIWDYDGGKTAWEAPIF